MDDKQQGFMACNFQAAESSSGASILVVL